MCFAWGLMRCHWRENSICTRTCIHWAVALFDAISLARNRLCIRTIHWRVAFIGAMSLASEFICIRAAHSLPRPGAPRQELRVHIIGRDALRAASKRGLWVLPGLPVLGCGKARDPEPVLIAPLVRAGAAFWHSRRRGSRCCCLLGL
jgi:hypothetical protein